MEKRSTFGRISLMIRRETPSRGDGLDQSRDGGEDTAGFDSAEQVGQPELTLLPGRQGFLEALRRGRGGVEYQTHQELTSAVETRGERLGVVGENAVVYLHEATHVTVAALLGLPVASVVVNPERGKGTVQIRYPGGVSRKEVVRAHEKLWSIVAMAPELDYTLEECNEEALGQMMAQLQGLPTLNNSTREGTRDSGPLVRRLVEAKDRMRSRWARRGSRSDRSYVLDETEFAAETIGVNLALEYRDLIVGVAARVAEDYLNTGRIRPVGVAQLVEEGILPDKSLSYNQIAQYDTEALLTEREYEEALRLTTVENKV